MASEVVQFFREAVLASLKTVPPTLYLEFQEAEKLLSDDERMRLIWPSAEYSGTLLHKLDDLNDALEECQDLVQQQQQRRLRSGLSTLGTRPLILSYVSKWQKSIYVSRMKKRLKSMNKDLAKFLNETIRDSRPPKRNITPFKRHTRLEADTSQFIGFGETEVKFQELLLSSETYKAIGIYGMSGSGKTAIVQKILNLPTVGTKFHPIIWICLSDIRLDEDADIAGKITRQILLKTGCDVDEWPVFDPTASELLKHLEKSLTSKKYLIVLDDVWQVSDFLSDLGHTRASPTGLSYDQLSYGLPKDSGGAVIITSRLKEIAEKTLGNAESKCMIHMEPLDSEKCKSLLFSKTEVAFQPYEHQILHLLNLKGYKAIGIYGPSCSENTRLIDKVLESSIVREQFSTILRVCVSEQDTPDKILGSLLSQLDAGIDTGELDEELTAWHFKIVKYLLTESGGRYLIVLDDVRHLDYWYSDLNSSFDRDYPSRLAQALPMDGGAVIVTTTGTRHVAEYLVGDRRLLIYVNIEDLLHKEIYPKGILDLCRGLPLAVTTIADIVREQKILSAWLSPASRMAKASHQRKILLAMQRFCRHKRRSILTNSFNKLIFIYFI